MMSGKCPVQAMSYIRDLGLFYVVFAFPEKSNPPVLYMCDWWVLTSSLYTVLFPISVFVEVWNSDFSPIWYYICMQVLHFTYWSSLESYMFCAQQRFLSHVGLYSFYSDDLHVFIPLFKLIRSEGYTKQPCWLLHMTNTNQYFPAILFCIYWY